MSEDSAAGPPSSDYWKTPSQRRLIGHFRDASDYDVAIYVDGEAVIVRRGGQDMRLGAAERGHFQRLFMQAEREAEAWTAQNPPGGADVVTAEIWCGFPRECPNGPAAHLWASACRDRPGELVTA